MHDPDHMGGSSDQTKVSFSSADIMFAQMMIPHHQQAVDMGSLAESRAGSPEVKALAARIKSEQAPEIDLMKDWLVAAGASESMDHHMSMDGMLTAEELDQLADSSGAAFDKLFLYYMIQHHEGAIAMAKMVDDSTNAAVAELARAIITSQTAEIAEMQKLLSD